MAFPQKVMWQSLSSRYHPVTFDKTAPATVVSGFYAKIYFEIDFVCLYFQVKRCMFEKETEALLSCQNLKLDLYRWTIFSIHL